jgi:hypothetical protein
MPKPIKQPKRPTDVNQWARQMVGESTQDKERTSAPPLPTASQVSAFMAEMGRKGGKIGGKRRLETMTSERRSEIALAAARTRWGKAKKKSSPT